MTSPHFLEVNNLSVEFKTRNGVVSALNDVCFHIDKSRVIGIVGESGSGKSVTALSIIGLLDSAGSISNGSILFDSINLSQTSEKELKELRGREISMIFQNPRASLNPIRPIGKQIEDVLLEHVQASRQNSREKAIQMLDKVKIANPEDRYWAYPFELSGGMCQRVMIAIALSCNPRFLIADEPTTGLDVTTQKASMDLIRDLTQTGNMSVMLITHDLGMAAQYCDHIVVMQSGNIVESAPVQQLFQQPRHPYTKKLIAASPGPDSSLSDLSIHTPNATDREINLSESSVNFQQGKKRYPGSSPLLEVINLVKEFTLSGQQTTSWPWQKNHNQPRLFKAVDNISFTIEAGECLGLVGESGCGKSTTSNIITRLLDPTSGDVILKGKNITTFPSSSFGKTPERTWIQMVFQDPTESLDPRYSARQCIAEPLRRLKGMRDSTQLSRKVQALAKMVDLPVKLLSRFPHQLSGGQKARVGIARAISVDPKLVILDEPTSALDVSVQAVVLQLLDRLKNELGMSYLFVSHDLNVVRLLCDRVIVMNQGQIIERGTAHDVLKHPQMPYTKNLIESIPHFDPNPA